MMKEKYESPRWEELMVQTEDCILETSTIGLDDYKNGNWNW